jgi:hypothetical protein
VSGLVIGENDNFASAYEQAPHAMMAQNSNNEHALARLECRAFTGREKICTWAKRFAARPFNRNFKIQ